MTPDKRLDQIEPVMADVLQKVDRLIEGQGQLVEVATRARQSAETAARGVANLTVIIHKKFDQADVRFDQVNGRFGEVDAQFTQVNTRFDQVDDRFIQVDTRFDQVDERFVRVDMRFDKVDTRFDQFDANQNAMGRNIADLKAGQELILQLLRQKLL